MRFNLVVRLLLFTLVLLAIPLTSSAGIIFSIGIAPPALPVYEQPLCPGDGYIWTPGYWAYDDADGYFWVPGTWVSIPETGFLWTPGYWGWGDGVYVFHEGYWGPQIGFYGGVNYGFGYGGVGYEGGYWNNGAFFYNRSVNNVTNVRNVYNKTVIVNNTYVSYNGGAGGVQARATAQEEAAARGRHIPPTSVQSEHVRAASTNRQLFESANHGKPVIAATAKPADFSGRGVVAAKAAAPIYKPATDRSVAPSRGNNAAPENRGEARPNNPVHPNELPPAARPSAPNTGKPQLDQKYQQQQQKLSARQDQERQKLQQSQEKEHQQLTQRKAPEPARQQVEQKHQQQTQQLQQRHETEQKQLQQRHPAPTSEPKEKH